jgi:hypothetical protein
MRRRGQGSRRRVTLSRTSLTMLLRPWSRLLHIEANEMDEVR